MKHPKPRKHILNTKVDIDTLNEVKHQASTKGVTVSTYLAQAIQSQLQTT
jgi:predicted DNA binding CopG/RHH family protein